MPARRRSQAQRLQLERRLRLYDPEVATANSSRELTVGSPSKRKHTVTRAVTVAHYFLRASPVTDSRAQRRLWCSAERNYRSSSFHQQGCEF